MADRRPSAADCPGAVQTGPVAAEQLPVRLAAFTAASSHERARGLLGYVEVELDSLRVSLALRRTRSGRLVLSWPRRRARDGRSHATVRPRDDGARRAIEAAVLAALGASEGAPVGCRPPGRPLTPRPDPPGGRPVLGPGDSPGGPGSRPTPVPGARP